MRILFVCTGNTCRSPMAEAIARKHIEDISFESAGIFADEGYRISKFAEEVLAENSYELLNFKSRRLNMSILDRASLILTMTSEQKEMINNFFKEERTKIFTLMEYNSKGKQCRDILDPFGGNIYIYRRILKEIEEEILKLKEKLRENI